MALSQTQLQRCCATSTHWHTGGQQAMQNRDVDVLHVLCSAACVSCSGSAAHQQQHVQLMRDSAAYACVQRAAAL